MKIVLAPDSFKGSLAACDVCTAMAAGIRRVQADAEIIEAPMADGGEGTMSTIMASTNGKIISRVVHGPLGDRVEAFFGILPDEESAVIEMASASGLTLVPDYLRNPRLTSSYGTGELIRAALDEGCRRIILGIGGSATNDGGTGIAEALGYRFLDAQGAPLPPGGLALSNLTKIEKDNRDPRLDALTIHVICDVTNPLTGPAGASLVYGPQKGADPETAELLDKALRNLAHRVAIDLGIDVLDLPGGGAAGGAGAGLVAFFGAELRNGVELIADLIGLASKVQDADLIITGEGRIDQQTRYGKVPYGVARIAKNFGKPVLAIAGSLGKGAQELHSYGIDGMIPIVNGPLTLKEAIDNADQLIASATEELIRIFCAGRNSV